MLKSRMGFAALAAVTLCIGPMSAARAQKIVINEFYRGGTLQGTGDEYIELLLIEDLTSTELETFFVGDSTTAKNNKFAAYEFTNMGSIASIFRKGTIIAVGGTGRFAQDTSYDPTAGDWSLLLTGNGSFLPNANTGNTGDIAANDVVWVDTVATGATISADGFGIDIGTTVGGFTPAADVDFGASTNNTGYVFNGSLAGITNTANWTTGVATGDVTPGLANGGENTTFITGLRTITAAAPEADSLALMLPMAAGLWFARRRRSA
ncbi:MAG: hypothetical protein SFU56_10580 [Capsulimonadales bacterium]|nr:hypothetical protein [Capsulimonadales bacterium]